MKPQSIAFAQSDLLTSVHGSGSAIGARFAALTNLAMPVHMRRKSIVSSYVEFDVAVTARNPFLAAFVVDQAVRQGRRCIVLPGGPGEDEWPYDLLMTKPLGELLVGIFGDERIDTTIPVALQLIGRFLKTAGEAVVIANAFGSPSISKRQPRTALALFGFKPASLEGETVDLALRSLSGAFRAHSKDIKPFEPASWGQTAIFCKELVVTGMADGLGKVEITDDCCFDWSDSRITALGSAASKPRSHEVSAHVMAQLLRDLPDFRFKD